MRSDLVQVGIVLIILGVMAAVTLLTGFIIMAVITSITKDKSCFKKLEMRFLDED
jgi:hypothetical protein